MSASILFHPFASGILQAPDADAEVLVLGAEPDFAPPEGFESELSLVQGFRTFFLPLSKAGWSVSPQPFGENFDAVLLQCGRHRRQNEAWLADALARVKPGGLVVAAGMKKAGIDSFRKQVAAAMQVEGHVSKFHGVAFWLFRPENWSELTPFVSGDGPSTAEFLSEPGMFSHGRADPGSELLVGCLPADLKGRVADFGAGWGYLSSAVAKLCPDVSGIDLFEADFASLEAAKANLAAVGATRKIGFFWHDLLSEPVEGAYDAVVMNPPFHQKREADPGLGQKMIAAAAKALRKGGRLFLVANRGLPYEGEMSKAFASVEELARDRSFRVFQAKR